MGTRSRSRSRRLAAVPAAALVLLAAAGCGAARVDAPVPTVPDDPPAVVVPPADPADDPQLAALTLPEAPAAPAPNLSTDPSSGDGNVDTSDGGAGLAAEEVARLDKLPALVAGVQAELGRGVQVCSVEVATSVNVRVAGGGSGAAVGEVVEWRLLADGTVAPFPAGGGECGETFPLDGPDYAAPARLAAGALARAPGARVSLARLAVDPTWGLAWRLSLAGGGGSAGVVADPAGSVRAVTPV